MAKNVKEKFDYENPANLEKVLEKYGNRLICFINRIIYDFNSSEDLMMDIFVELLIRKPNFDSEKALKSYLFTCAKNKAINYSKKYKKLMLLEEQTLKDVCEIEEQVFSTHTKKILIEAMKKLNNNYRTVLYLAYFEDMSNEELSNVLSLNDKQVRNLKHRAGKKLNKILREQKYIYNFEGGNTSENK